MVSSSSILSSVERSMYRRGGSIIVVKRRRNQPCIGANVSRDHSLSSFTLDPLRTTLHATPMKLRGLLLSPSLAGKLLLAELEFLMEYDSSKAAVVVYVGAGPGDHIPVLIRFINVRVPSTLPIIRFWIFRPIATIVTTNLSRLSSMTPHPSLSP